ncbi:disulfide bond formation protein DsbB [Sodalis endosymbiont of Henestaris halophilus]|uniref:disulfide bond formation protein DsbB n=1 Tax=Sodalis endosymbiont of Henestaris halophilus TaxID=1929246 RepID=UPI000BC0454F|nr:disulfide bond formation protein DsbB [Sodalis endosymbiont of Henestaris halophilus]SNC58734.1 Disulfide bond formation protein B [Sodalis endosymbiont of Henestaris halophilus]
MMQSLNRFSQSRAAWLLLSLTAFILELIALYFQHVLMLNPCVLCIYQRCALYGVISAGLVGAIMPGTWLRFAGLTIWLYSSWQGLLLAMKHTDIQLHPSPFVTCDFCVNFPTWLPLDKWLPSMFSPTGDCALRQWHLLSLEMPQWMIIIFSAYLLVAAIILLAQYFPSRKRNLFPAKRYKSIAPH